jgi:hypothetical protein
MNGLEPQRRPELLATIAVTQAAAGNHPASAATLQEATALATALTQDWRRSYALVAVIRASADLRDVATARRLAQQVSDRSWQAAAWEEVAVAQARAGDAAGARQTVGAIADRERRNLALIGIGRAQAKAGDVQGTLATAALASGHARARILREAAKAQAAAGDIVRARAIASVISEEGESSAALRAIARAQLGRGDVKNAQATVALLPPIAQTYVIGEVAAAQVKAGDVAGALATARSAPTTDYGWMALRDVAIAQAAAGDLAAARQTAASIGDASIEYQDTAEAVRGISAIQAKRGDVKGAVSAALAQTAAAPKAFGLLGAAQGLLDGAGRGRAEPVRRNWEHDRDDGIDD